MKYFFCGTYFLLSSSVNVQALGLKEVLEAAYNNNKDFQAEKQNVLIQEQRLNQAFAGWHPTISASATIAKDRTMNAGTAKEQATFSSPTSLQDKGTTRQGALTLKQNLFQGGGTKASVAQSKQTLKNVWAKLSVKEQEILTKVIQNYLDILAKQTEITLYQANLEANKKNKEFAESKFKIGEETRTQLAVAETKLADADSRLEIAKASLEGLRATFEALTGLKCPQKLETASAIGTLPKELKDLLEEAMKKNPSLLAAQANYEAARKNVDVQSSALSPSVDFVASSTYSNSKTESRNYPFPDNSKRNAQTTDNRVAIQVTIPLYEGGATAAKIREAHETSIAQRIGIENTKNQLRETVIQAWTQYKAAISNIAQYKIQVASGEIRLEGTQREMEAGTKILLDVLNAQTDLLEAQLNLVQAQKSVLQQHFVLSQLLGRLDGRSLNLNVDYFQTTSYNEY